MRKKRRGGMDLPASMMDQGCVGIAAADDDVVVGSA